MNVAVSVGINFGAPNLVYKCKTEYAQGNILNPSTVVFERFKTNFTTFLITFAIFSMFAILPAADVSLADT